MGQPTQSILCLSTTATVAGHFLMISSTTISGLIELHWFMMTSLRFAKLSS
ncbi:hypothetical protein X727_23535 [Mesorhizobium sp. L103C119B0]|nr:hypothetical protein X727_23535 [Mesorhizobium sp. L103C119B0]